MRTLGQTILGTGIDMIEIARIDRALQKGSFADRIYTPEEQQELSGRPAASWAARFAAKEAVMKALGTGWQQGIGFQQIRISRDVLGKPTVLLNGAAASWARENSIERVLLSISHTKHYALASATAVGREANGVCGS